MVINVWGRVCLVSMPGDYSLFSSAVIKTSQNILNLAFVVKEGNFGANMVSCLILEVVVGQKQDVNRKS